MIVMPPRIKTNPGRKRNRNPEGSRRGKNPRTATHEKILEAAKRVFAEHPYYAASIRMVGKAAGIDHPLISYYFRTKAELFEAVVEDMTDTYYQANIAWFDGIERMSPSGGLSVFIDRLLDFALEHPEALRIVALNLVQPEESPIIPGYQRIQGLFARTSELFQQVSPLQGSPEEIRRFTESFNTLVINYLGAGTYYAGILGMDPRSPDYLQWVKETLMFLFLPRLKKLIRGAA
jgi:AcrR family transcriptional regulator